MSVRQNASFSVQNPVNRKDVQAGAPSANPHLILVHERLQTLTPTQLEVIDESHLHVGHAGAQNGASHLRVNIASPRFDALSRVQRHQLVYDTLRDLIPFPIHALAISASTVSSRGSL